jgi:hypothetical protein
MMVNLSIIQHMKEIIELLNELRKACGIVLQSNSMFRSVTRNVECQREQSL